MNPFCFEDPCDPAGEFIRSAFEYAVGQAALNYMETLHDREIAFLAENKAVATLAQIYDILQDDGLEDPECFQKIDQIIMLFSSNYKLTDSRHLYLD